ncbi:hypothetical protein DPX16_5640 [Anabarilius grahami]|uniref:Secreted protein n=1 Tax=Anabarilius grahami TaxID=495550 RepID=A0A3N0YPW2_ANAGA|nr:hypothetical protein DPX16_5640 [Anabarilius grahami]
MGPHRQVILTLLVLMFVTYICEAALLRKSSAVDFLRSGREKRAVRCQHEGCSSEDSDAEELLEANSDYVARRCQTCKHGEVSAIPWETECFSDLRNQKAGGQAGAI